MTGHVRDLQGQHERAPSSGQHERAPSGGQHERVPSSDRHERGPSSGRHERVPSGESRDSLSNKINSIVLNYNPKYKINIHESTLIKIND